MLRGVSVGNGMRLVSFKTSTNLVD